MQSYQRKYCQRYPEASIPFKVEESRCFQLLAVFLYLDSLKYHVVSLVRDAASFFNGLNLSFILNQAQFHDKVC